MPRTRCPDGTRRNKISKNYEKPKTLKNNIPPSVITVPKTNQYTSSGENYFKIKFVFRISSFRSSPTNSKVLHTMRDIYVDLDKNTLSTLHLLSKRIHLKNYSKLKKPALVDLIKQHIKFE